MPYFILYHLPVHLSSDFQESAFCELWILSVFLCTSFLTSFDKIFNLYTRETKPMQEKPVKNTYSLVVNSLLSVI